MSTFARVLQSVPLMKDASESGNLKVLMSLLGPAYRGMIARKGKSAPVTAMPAGHDVHFTWGYAEDRPQLARLYQAALVSQWHPVNDLPWSVTVDPSDEAHHLLPWAFLPPAHTEAFRSLSPVDQARQRRDLVAWLMSQFLHGEQGALFAACQVTEAVPWLEGKLYGSTQVMDEGRHVEVFHRYLVEKLEKKYEINDNLYTVVDALMTDRRWDMKFLGMQIMIEGLALGAFGMIQQRTREPLLKALLTQVITDEARHVHYGVLALSEHVGQLSERERREREDWAFEVSLFLRNRFYAHEFYEEHYAAHMSRRSWEQLVLESEMMAMFRRTMFKRVIPNLKRIGLLSERVRGRYAELGLLDFEHGKAAPELTAQDLLDDKD